MKKYSFSMTKKEIMEFSIRAVLEQMRLQLALWLGMLAICALDALVAHWIGILLVAFIIGVIILMIYQCYSMTKKNWYGKTRTMWVEAGLLKVDDVVYGETPCSSIKVIRKTGSLLMLGIYQARKRLAWYPMPLRVFSDIQDMDEFLKMVQFPMASYGQDIYTMPVDDKEENTKESELFHFFFQVNEEKWERVLIDTTEIIRSGVMGGSKKNKVILALSGGYFVIFICGCIFNIDYKLLFLIFITLLFMLNLASNNMINPEKFIYRQWRERLMKSEDYGKWRVSVSEKWVTCDKPNLGRTMMSWNKLSSMVESDTAFYLFLTDKKHFVMILKECIENHGQAEALKWLCKEKNIAVAMSKKVKHVPYWVFTLLLAVLIFICLFLLACGII